MPDERELIREFSQELISARRYKGVTIVQISDATKIQRRYLEAIEQGEWDVLPQPYMEAFLKAYAEAVGMNIPKVMKRYRDMRRHLLAAQASEAEPESEVEEAAPAPTPGAQPSRGWIKYTVAGIVILTLIAAASILHLRSAKTVRESVPAEEVTSTAVQESTSASIPADSSAKSSALKPDSLSGKADTATLLKAISESLTIAQHEIPVGVNLLARATHRCWLKANLDRKENREVLLAAGDTAVFRADEVVQLLVGNAGGLELEMDGRSLGVLGPEGKAVTVVINPDGIQSQKLGKGKIAFDTSRVKSR